MRLALIFAATLILTLHSVTQAQQAELIERTFSGVSKEATPVAAKKDIQDQAAAKISEEIIKELIGEAKFLKNKTLIQSKVIKNSSRYIPFFKPSEVTQENEEYKMSVALKLSVRDLKQILQSQSLLNENDSSPVVLPVISWNDRAQGRSFRWWLPLEKTPQIFLMKEARLFEEALRSSFQRNNFYVITPVKSGLATAVPTDYQSEKLSGGEDSQFFAQYFNAPLLIDGQVLITKGERGNNYRIEVRMTAVQVSNSRAIADVSRRFDTEPGPLESVVDKKMREVLEPTSNDLASQVLEAWQRGSMGTSIIRLTIRGKSPLPLIETLKDKIRSQVTQLRNVRERLVSSDSVSFEVDTSATTAEVMTKLETLEVDGRKLSKVSESQNEIVLSWAQ